MTSPTEARLEILADPEALSRRVAEWMLELAKNKDGVFSVCLSGGSTPQQLYEHLAEPTYRDAFPWSRTHWFWGDERFVSHDDPLSNYRMVREALLSRAPILPANIHPIPTECINPETSASAYERELKSFYGAARLDPARPLFDVNLLGLGPDGHTASLFPGSVLRAHRWVAAVAAPRPRHASPLTHPPILAATPLSAAGTRKGRFREARGDNRPPAASSSDHRSDGFWIGAAAPV
jgi:6-phosphogluconolactonase